MPGFRYPTVHEDLLAAFPELAAPFSRFHEWWTIDEDTPVGQYVVFADLYGLMLQILLSLPDETQGREALLSRAFVFGEALLAAQDGEVRGLGVDAFAQNLDRHTAGRQLAPRMGGEALQNWLMLYGQSTSVRQADDELIDLWGVRDAIAPLLPATRLPDIPGISHPRDWAALSTLAEAKSLSDGVVILSGYGTTHLYVVVRADRVAARHETLQAVAKELAERLGGDNPRGNPDARFRRIPHGERVWNMHTANQRHSRLDDEPWLTEPLTPIRSELLNLLSGKIDRLP